MPKKDRIREPLTALPTLDYLVRRVQSGWKLVALEWEREETDAAPQPPDWVEEIPFGLQVSEDCSGLVENPSETEAIIIALDMIVEDCPLSRVADELNQRGYRMRGGKPWTPSVLFQMLPRMIQVGPRVFSSSEWTTRRKRLPKVV